MDEEGLILAGLRSPDCPPMNSGTTSSGKTIVKPAWLTKETDNTAASPPVNSTPSSEQTSAVGQAPTPVAATSSSWSEPHPSEPPQGNGQNEPCPTSGGKKPPTRRLQKRRIASTSTPQEKRLRPRTQNRQGPPPGEEEDVEMASDKGNNDLLEEIRKMHGQLKTELKSDVSQAVEKLGDQVKKNSDNIAQLQQDIDTKIASSVAEAVTREMGKRTMGGTVSDTTQNTRYWRSRRSVRCWPVRGNDSELWGLTGDFFTKVLGIPPSNIPQDSVKTIRRISTPRSKRPVKIQAEVIVVFKDVSTRDMVFSYAPNLAQYRQNKEPPGIRLDYPDHLRGAFTTLEKYGILMKSEHGGNFRRSIKFDDSLMSLRIDVCFPGDTEWTQVPLELAAEEVGRRKEQENQKTRERLSSMSSVGSATSASSAVAGPSTSSTSNLTRSTTLIQHSRLGPPSRWGAPC